MNKMAQGDSPIQLANLYMNSNVQSVICLSRCVFLPCKEELKRQKNEKILLKNQKNFSKKY